MRVEIKLQTLKDQSDSILSWRQTFNYFTDYYKIGGEPAVADIAEAFGWLGYISMPFGKQGIAKERRVYNLLDLLSEMGGFSSSILSLFVLAVGFYNTLNY